MHTTALLLSYCFTTWKFPSTLSAVQGQSRKWHCNSSKWVKHVQFKVPLHLAVQHIFMNTVTSSSAFTETPFRTISRPDVCFVGQGVETRCPPLPPSQPIQPHASSTCDSTHTADPSHPHPGFFFFFNDFYYHYYYYFYQSPLAEAPFQSPREKCAHRDLTKKKKHSPLLLLKLIHLH